MESQWNGNGMECQSNKSPAMEMEAASCICDEEYLILQSRFCRQGLVDPFAAKAWLITAKTLFPRNFGIQFEVYSNEKAANNREAAAKYLEDLFTDFQCESGLWKEVRAITEALQAEAVDRSRTFLTDVFNLLPTDVQHEMLLSAADRSDDTQEHCKLLLLLLKKFPNKVSLHGLKLVDTLLTAEKHSHHAVPVNCFRKLLVCDILPLIFKSAGFEFLPKQLHRLLNKTVEFYVSYITQPLPGPAPTSSSLAPIPGLLENESAIESPWDRLYEALHSVGQKLGWDLKDIFVSTSKELQWQRIQMFYQMTPVEERSAFHKQVFFCTAILFVNCLYDYALKSDPELFAAGNANGNSQPSLVLIEGFRNEAADKSDLPRMKKKQMRLDCDDASPVVHVSKAVQGLVTGITPSFLTAKRCWDLLHSTEPLEKDFKRLCQQLRMETWPWFLSFQLDSFIYHGLYHEAISRLHQLEGFGPTSAFQNKVNLRLASCYHCLRKDKEACERILKVVAFLPNGSGPPVPALFSNKPGRHLYFLNYSRQEVLQYCIKLILICFKERAMMRSRLNAQDDLLLGHMLVLLQYDWPHTESLFTHAVKTIQEQGRFTYRLFFNYIINIDMLEEFAHLATPSGGSVSLDLFQVSTSQIAKQRTITRGVNKGAKEDFRSAMERQVGRCEESLDQLLIQFLAQEVNPLQL